MITLTCTITCLIFILLPACNKIKKPLLQAILDIAIIKVLSLSIASILIFFYLVSIAENKNSNLFVVNNVLSHDECSLIISSAELEAVKLKGWTTKRHRNYPTTDLSVYSINQTIHIENSKVTYFIDWLNDTILASKVFPLISRYYNVNSGCFVMRDMFVVKYDADTPGRQRRLQVHQDGAIVSFNIALNQGKNVNRPLQQLQDRPVTNNILTHQQEFSGGGTYFPLLNETVQLDSGAMLIHLSRLYHAGAEVLSGKRYILVGFVNIKRQCAHRPFFSSSYSVLRKQQTVGAEEVNPRTQSVADQGSKVSDITHNDNTHSSRLSEELSKRSESNKRSRSSDFYMKWWRMWGEFSSCFTVQF